MSEGTPRRVERSPADWKERLTDPAHVREEEDRLRSRSRNDPTVTRYYSPIPFLRGSGWRTVLGGAWVVLLVAACGGPQAPPGPGYERGGLPDLGGSAVMLLPVQLRAGVHPDLDRELEYALAGADGRIRWMPPDALRDVVARNPGQHVPLDNLPVRAFQAGELERIGDPLFGHLYRLGVLSGAEFALIPVEAGPRDRDDGASVQLSAALVEVRTGWVRWFGVVEGSVGPPGDLAAAASAAEALARLVSR